VTRKYLGIDENRTVQWLINCKNCRHCFEGARLSLEYNDTVSWDSLRKHVELEHMDEELCLDCHIWLDDVEFADHLWNKHAKAWKGMNSPLYKEFKLDEP
jgi:hypothetical protein